MRCESIIKLDGFRSVPIILLHNKFDLLEQRMRKIAIMNWFPE